MKIKLLYKILSLPAILVDFFYRNNLRILAYHEVRDELLFEKQLKFLTSRYNIISLEMLLDHINNQRPLPKRSLLITFDDGDRSVLDKGLPVLLKYRCTAILFIITELIGTSKNFWFKQVREIEKKKGKSSKEINQIMSELKNLQNKDRVKKMASYGTGSHYHLSVNDLKFMERNGFWIANHSHSHPMFNRCTEEEIIEELGNTKSFFQNQGLSGYNIFAYPNGNQNLSSERVLKGNGIELAFLFDHRISKKKIDPLRISRIRVNSDTDIPELKVKVSGLHSGISILKSFIGKAKNFTIY